MLIAPSYLVSNRIRFDLRGLQSARAGHLTFLVPPAESTSRRRTSAPHCFQRKLSQRIASDALREVGPRRGGVGSAYCLGCIGAVGSARASASFGAESEFLAGCLTHGSGASSATADSDDQG